MVDSQFFHNAGAVSLKEIAALTGAVITSNTSANPADTSYTNVAPLDRAGAKDVSFLDNVKYVDAFAASKAGACFVRPKFSAHAPAGMVLLVTDEPYYCYALTARRFYPDAKTEGGISPHAHVAKSATIGKDVRIDAGTVIGEHVQIGDGCQIGANCTISHAILGKNVILHRGIHIGQDGFGYAAGSKGMVKVPQLGRVIIESDVEIGSGTCIDRGAGPDTIIGQGSKIDNLVQIGHNVQLGKYVVIAAQCGIAGSTQIGDGTMIGGQVGISGHVRIGARAKIAAQSGVMTDVPPGATYGGAPAMPVRDWHRQTAAIARMVRKKDYADE